MVPGAVSSAEVVKLDEAKTVNGKPITISATGGGVMVNDAKVTAADVQAANGVIHVIDSVILPPQG